MKDKRDGELNQLVERISAWREQRYKAQKLWSLVHHLALFGSVISSVIAGTLIQLEYSGMAMVGTTIAAVLSGIAASGGFERKWRSNRISRSHADCLLVELDRQDVDLASVRQRFIAAIEKHDLEVVGETVDSDD